MTGSLLLALDQGTSATKAALFTADGSQLAVARRPVDVRRPSPDAAEGDAEQWWVAAVACVREVLRAAGVTGRDVGAIGCCGFMHTLVPTASDGRPVGPAILWSDQRAVRTEAADPRTSCAGRIDWWRRRDAASANAVAALLPVKDHLRARFTGDFATDTYEADALGLFDLERGEWCTDAPGRIGFALDRLPPVRRADDAQARVSAAAAAATGLRAGTPVVVGTGDWMAVLLGVGAVLPERAAVYIGSAGVVGGFASASDAADAIRTRVFGAASSTGSALDWVVRLVGAAGHLDELARRAGALPPGGGLTFAPHLAGERKAGHVRPVGGAFVGLTPAHGPEALVRAVVEGTVQWLHRISADGLAEWQPAELVAVGGGARSSLWLDVIANVFGRPVGVPAVLEAGLLGAAALAARGVGRPIGGQPAVTQPIVREVAPDPALADAYAEARRRFDALEDAAASWLLP